MQRPHTKDLIAACFMTSWHALTRLQVLLVDKMRIKVEQLQAEVQKGESLQDRLSTLQAEAERLPALRTRLYALQVRAGVRAGVVREE